MKYREQLSLLSGLLLAIVTTGCVNANALPATDNANSAPCRSICLQLLDSGQGNKFWAVMTKEKVSASRRSFRFEGFDVYGTSSEQASFESMIADIKRLGIYGELLRNLGSSSQFETIVLSGHPEVLIAGSVLKICDGIPWNPDFLYFIDINDITTHFQSCSDAAGNGSIPSWATTQCGLLAHELVEASQFNSGNAHQRGIAIQNNVRQAYGGHELQPARTLELERCYTWSGSISDCDVVFDGTWNHRIETIHRSCGNRIESITYKECSSFDPSLEEWVDCTAE